MFRVISENRLSFSAVISTRRRQSSPKLNAARFGSHTIRGYDRTPTLSPALGIFPDPVVSFLASLKLESWVSWTLVRQCNPHSSNESLAAIISQILEGLYSIKQIVPSRHREAARLEEILEKWLLVLPDYLKVDINSIKNGAAPPAPHILILHMQYWNAVLLLHRPL